ncbi:MAG TPA: hypothetical protein VHC70_00620 [Phycisphaerales bacterium]|jgi:hypothetical protein|nr:hypothetical protein [Phycisphaerales bacterium]
MGSNTLIDEAQQRIAQQLAEGFSTPVAISESVIEMLSDEHPTEEVQRIVESLMPMMLAERQREIAGWPSVTDCDRLDAAFEDLNARGIMARHHWTCCSTCGRAEMPDEFNRLGGRWRGVPIIGYTFYHIQDTESAADGGGIYLNYGSCERAADEAAYEKACLRVAGTIRETLERLGLPVIWDGTYAKKLQVPLKWQRRARPARFCEGDRHTD